jgi:hypothetical protein
VENGRLTLRIKSGRGGASISRRKLAAQSPVIRRLNFHVGPSSKSDNTRATYIVSTRSEGCDGGSRALVCEVTEYDADILKPMIGLAVESGHEGRGGRHVGTLFTLERANTQALDRRARYNRDAQTRAGIRKLRRMTTPKSSERPARNGSQ